MCPVWWPRRKVRRPALRFLARQSQSSLFPERRAFGEVQRDFRFGRKRLLSKPGVVDREILCFAHDDRSLNHVLQFADVPWPGVGAKQVEAFFGYPLYVLSHFPRALIDEVSDQHRNVFSSFSQRRHINRENVDPVKQVTTKRSLTHVRLQITLGSSY